MSAQARLSELGIELAEPPTPAGNYLEATRTGNLVFLAGHGPRRPDGTFVTGKVGSELDIDEGYAAARLVGITLLSTLRAEIGDLDKVTKIVKVLGMVNAEPDFGDLPAVINGTSDLLVEVFGDKGRHARSAVGMNTLPFGISVEVEMIVEVED